MHRPDWAVTGAVTEAVRPEINVMPDKLSRALAVTPYLFGGEHGVMTDPTGLVHMRARYYHPGLRRFVNPDPIGFAGGMNWYGYAGGSPVMMVDPSGFNPDALYFALEPLVEKINPREIGPLPGLAHTNTPFGRPGGSISHYEPYFEQRWPNNLSFAKSYYHDFVARWISSNVGETQIPARAMPSIAVDTGDYKYSHLPVIQGLRGSYISITQHQFGDTPESKFHQEATLGTHYYDFHADSFSVHYINEPNGVRYAWSANIYAGDNTGNNELHSMPAFGSIFLPQQSRNIYGRWTIYGSGSISTAK